MGGRTLNVVALREWEGISLPAHGAWMRLADAVTCGIELGYVAEAIGPRVRGMVYRSGYPGDVSTVHDVFVRVMEADTDPNSGMPRPCRAVHWEIAEESAMDHGRVRRHCTSWQCGTRNQPLLTFATT